MEIRKTVSLLGLLIFTQLIIFAPHVGTGFVTDDFIWLGNVVTNGEVDCLKPFSITTGFYRPMVSLTFGLQYRLHGMNAGPYGWFNLFLHLLNVILVFLLFSTIEVSRPYSLAAAALFAFNVKGNIMAVGWISGRTTLLFTFFMLISLLSYVKLRRQPPKHGQKPNLKRILLHISAALFYLAALLSKETALAAPVFVFLFSFFIQNTGDKTSLQKARTAFLSTLVFLLPLLLYCVLRIKSNAIDPFNAPDIYRYTLAPGVILKNLWEYITRAAVLDILIIVWLAAVVLVSHGKLKSAEKIDGKTLIPGLGWFLCFLLTVLPLPVRSDIYVYFPQVGLHLMSLVLIFYLWKKIKKTKAVLLPLILIIFAWIGYFYVRAGISAEKGKSSVVFTRQVVQAVSKMKTGSRIFIVDMDRDKRYSPTGTVAYGFASLLNLYYPHKRFTGEIIPPGKVAQIKCNKNSLNFFFREKGQLAGPLNCTGLRDFMLFYFGPHMNLQQTEERTEKTEVKRLYRLKKRKMRLKRQKKRLPR